MNEQPLTRNIRRDRAPLDLAAYESAGGYQAVRKALGGLAPEDVAKQVQDANLRGTGRRRFSHRPEMELRAHGRGRPPPEIPGGQRVMRWNRAPSRTGCCWRAIPTSSSRAIIIAAYAIQAEIAYIFLRRAYVTAGKRLASAIAEAYAKGYLGRNILGSGFRFDLHIHESAGRYICGEETALLNALEGKRAVPAGQTALSPVVGLWGKPTVANNVETLSNVPHIILNGPAWFRGLSRVPDGGTKIYGASGKVRRPGAWELPLGVTIREILEEHAGGMQEGFGLRALLPGGASTDLVTADHLDVPMDFEFSATGRQPYGHRHHGDCR